MTDALAIIAVLINLVALGGFAYWLRGLIKAQQQTLSAYKALLDVMDTPQMLERFQAYRKIVDEEKRVLLDGFERTLAEEKQKMSKDLNLSFIQATNLMGNLFEISSRLMPYVPVQERRRLLEAMDVDAYFIEPLDSMAKQAPDLSNKDRMRVLGDLDQAAEAMKALLDSQAKRSGKK